MQPLPAQPPTEPTDAEREAAAAVLRDAVGAGTLTLEEFTERVTAVWAAENTDHLRAATNGVSIKPVVGSNAKSVSSVVAILGDQQRAGRWRLPGRLRTFCILGDVHLDLRSVVCAEEVVEIHVWALMGDIEVEVPDGVEVELRGVDLLGDRELRLAPVPRAPGTPLIRIRAHSLMGDVSIRSSSAGTGTPGWRRFWLKESSPPVDPAPRDPHWPHRPLDPS